MYTERAREIVNSTYYGDEPISSEVSKGHSMIVVASDDPLVYESGDFAGAARAQDQIRLASKSAIQQANPDRSAMHKFVDETFGWEGGFFAAMFWNLGVSTPSATNAGRAPPETGALPPSAETIQLRSLLGRAYMLDLCGVVRHQRCDGLHRQRHGLPPPGRHDGLGGCHGERCVGQH